ncbi:GrpB family protein [Dongia sp.]|uniref:GrpB family protein n=1 Tax=Dongia sp. TaxID=1977262 RepID=UPI0035B11F4D
MDEIALVAYDPRWPEMFAEEAARLRATLDPTLILDIQHFGSTAIPGLRAKPIIDILIAVPSLAIARARFVAPLDRLDYAFWAENPKSDRLFFVKGLPPYGAGRTHHVHVAEPDAEPWQRLPFRDYLRAHPEAARRYEALKLDLAARYRNDREAYTVAKDDFVREILAKIARA